MVDDFVAARGAVIEIESATADQWLDITPYLESLEPDPSEGTERQDANVWGNRGWHASRVTGRGMKFALTFKASRDTTTGTLTPGQARLVQLSRAMMADAQGRLRWREHEALTQWEIWEFNVDNGTREGGETFDLAALEFDLMCSGEPTYEDVD